MRIRITSLFLLALLAAGPVVAQEKVDAAARAKAVAPFVDEQTFAVIHVDTTRVQVGPLVEKLFELIPDARDDKPNAKAEIQQAQDAFRKAGGKDLYLVFSMTDVMQRDPFALIVPLGPGADEKALTDLFSTGFELEKQRNQGIQKAAGALVIGDRDKIKRLQAIKPSERPSLAAAFEAAGDTTFQALVIPPDYMRRVVEETMPQLPKEVGGGASTVVTRGLQWAALGIELPPKLSARLVVKSQDAQAAEALKAKWLELLRIVSQMREARAVLPNVDKITSLLVPKVEGDRLTLTFDEQGKEITELWKAVQVPLSVTRRVARRSESVNNLKQIALAMHMFHDGHKRFPAPANYGPDGKPLLSWRVHLLPFVEQQQLYQQFHLDEPWDSAHNKALIDKIPPVFRSPLSKAAKGMTNYVLPVGPGTGFPGREGLQFPDIKDGTSNTIMILEVNDDHAVTWTKPDDLPFDPKTPLKGLGGLNKDGFNAAYFDGSVRFIPLKIPPETLRALITPAGGEVVPQY